MIETSASPLPTELRDSLARAIAQVNTVVLGKRREVRLAFVCLLAGGHLLIEDLPGVGKTTLAHALAATLGLNFQRVQFTSDLLPSDIIGVGIYEREAGRFKFHAGPLFTQLLLADEINSATGSRRRSSSSRRRTRWISPAPTRCRNRSSTASCCA